MRRSSVVACILSVAMSASASAQVDIELSELEQQYADAARNVLEGWEVGEFTFSRTPANMEVFAVRYNAFVQRHLDDPLRALIPMEFVAENWEKLPDELEAVLPISAGAKLLLIGAIVDATERLAEMGIEPDPDELAAELNYAFYTTLGPAQEEAMEAGRTAIDSISVRRGGVWLFSLGWPFCCAVE